MQVTDRLEPIVGSQGMPAGRHPLSSNPRDANTRAPNQPPISSLYSFTFPFPSTSTLTSYMEMIGPSANTNCTLNIVVQEFRLADFTAPKYQRYQLVFIYI